MTVLQAITPDLTVNNRLQLLIMLAAERQRLSREQASEQLRQAIKASPKTWTRILNNTSQPDLRQLVILRAELGRIAPDLASNLDDLITIN